VVHLAEVAQLAEIVEDLDETIVTSHDSAFRWRQYKDTGGCLECQLLKRINQTLGVHFPDSRNDPRIMGKSKAPVILLEILVPFFYFLIGTFIVQSIPENKYSVMKVAIVLHHLKSLIVNQEIIDLPVGEHLRSTSKRLQQIRSADDFDDWLGKNHVKTIDLNIPAKMSPDPDLVVVVDLRAIIEPHHVVPSKGFAELESALAEFSKFTIVLEKPSVVEVVFFHGIKILKDV